MLIDCLTLLLLHIKFRDFCHTQVAGVPKARTSPTELSVERALDLLNQPRQVYLIQRVKPDQENERLCNRSSSELPNIC